MQKIWKIKEVNKALQNELSKSLKILPITAQLLINRGVCNINSANLFLSTHHTHLYDPFRLKGMKDAVSLIKDAIKNDKNILIWGDYDVDGITSTALLYLTLKKMKAKVDFYIPHRLKEGYGLNMEGIKSIKDKTDLLIALDCGIDAKDEVEFLKKQGKDVIIVDHHHPKKGSVPDCIVVNPLQEDCSYPFKHLAAVGLSFKLSQALLGEDLEEHLDLVGLGTIADVVPMVGENRLLVKRSLDIIGNSKKHGIKALCEAGGIAKRKMNPTYVGFILAPRINASGRLNSAEKSLELLLSDSYEKAAELAQYLNNENQNRQKIEAGILTEALGTVERCINFKDTRVIVLAGKGWHPGVLGIVASRLLERFHRPVVLLASENGILKGSARSIEGFHIFDALSKCSRHLLEFGGHRLAAGLSLKEEGLDNFIKAINDVAFDVLTHEDLVPSLDIDMEIKLSDVNESLLDQIDVLAPFGPENPQPLFASARLKVKDEPIACGKDTLKFWVESNGTICQAVGFKMGSLSPLLKKGDFIDLAYKPVLNSWHGVDSITLQVKDFRPSAQRPS